MVNERDLDWLDKMMAERPNGISLVLDEEYERVKQINTQLLDALEELNRNCRHVENICDYVHRITKQAISKAKGDHHGTKPNHGEVSKAIR